MDAEGVMKELEALGTEQNRKVYQRHGASEPLFGVSFAKLSQLKKRIECNQPLADALWSTGNVDAQVLACMIAAPKSFDRAKLDAWAQVVGTASYYVLCGSLANLAARGSLAQEVAAAWVDSEREYVAATGWDLVASLALRANSDLESMSEILDRVVAEIRDAPNRVRHSMNMALIAIGGTHAALEKRALEAAALVGTVEVDHGETGCKTPDAAGYMLRMAARRARAAGGGKKKLRARG